jgi:ABC-type amino acid transport substrate-binding protein
MVSLRRRSILLIPLLLLLSTSYRGALAVQEDQTPLRVVTKPLPPFVIKSGDSFIGFSIELWDALAEELNVPYEFYEVETVTQQLEAVENNEADVAIAGITITEIREEFVDFTYPYFDSGLQILVLEHESSPLLNTVRAILSESFLQYLLVFLLLILVTAHIYWFFERRNPQFPSGYRQGITQVLWWTTVTVIGYDDKPPGTRFGRFIAIIWMFAGIFLIANLTATLSAGATVRELRSSIRSISDLQGQRVVTVGGSTSANHLRSQGIQFSEVTIIEEAYDALLQGKADAIVYDAPVLRYYVANAGNPDLELVGTLIETEKYGIALPTGSPYREPINRATLKLMEDGTYQELYERWFGANPA